MIFAPRPIINTLVVALACFSLLCCQSRQLNGPIHYEYYRDIDFIGFKFIDRVDLDTIDAIRVGIRNGMVVNLKYSYYNKEHLDTIIYEKGIPNVVAEESDTDYSYCSNSTAPVINVDSNRNSFSPFQGIIVRPLVRITSCNENYAVCYLFRKKVPGKLYGLYQIDTLITDSIHVHFPGYKNLFANPLDFIDKEASVWNWGITSRYYVHCFGTKIVSFYSIPVTDNKTFIWTPDTINNYRYNSQFFSYRRLNMYHFFNPDEGWLAYYLKQFEQ